MGLVNHFRQIVRSQRLTSGDHKGIGPCFCNLLDQLELLTSGQFVFHGILIGIHMTVNTVEVTGSSNLPYQDNRCPRRLWSGRPEMAESSKVIDD